MCGNLILTESRAIGSFYFIFLIYTIIWTLSTGEADDPQAGVNEINAERSLRHIYFIDGCRLIKIERNNLLCEQAPTEVFRSIFAWLVTLNFLHIRF